MYVSMVVANLPPQKRSSSIQLNKRAESEESGEVHPHDTWYSSPKSMTDSTTHHMKRFAFIMTVLVLTFVNIYFI